jgi:hypothetical protein
VRTIEASGRDLMTLGFKSFGTALEFCITGEIHGNYEDAVGSEVPADVSCRTRKRIYQDGFQGISGVKLLGHTG